jgi:hypothetical protein
MNNLSGSTKGYIDENKVVKPTSIKEVKKSKINNDDLNKLTKSISEDFIKLSEKCDSLYEMKSLKEIYDLIITINSAQKDLMKIKNI